MNGHELALQSLTVSLYSKDYALVYNVVKSNRDVKGFGFIIQNGIGPDFSVHRTAVSGGALMKRQ